MRQRFFPDDGPVGNYTEWVLRRFRTQERPSQNWPNCPTLAVPQGPAGPALHTWEIRWHYPPSAFRLRIVLHSTHIAVTRVLEGDGAIWKTDGNFILRGDLNSVSDQRALPNGKTPRSLCAETEQVRTGVPLGVL